MSGRRDKGRPFGRVGANVHKIDREAGNRMVEWMLCDKCLAVCKRGGWLVEDFCNRCAAKMQRLLDGLFPAGGDGEDEENGRS